MIRKGSHKSEEYFGSQHRFEHWYCDNNDQLPDRLLPFWVDAGHQNYFDGSIRDELQCRRAYRYTLTQCSRHKICRNPHDYPHTRVGVELERAVKRALTLNAFLTGVPYRRYERHER